MSTADNTSQNLAALRLCTYPQFGAIKPTGAYLVEVLARLERRPVPAEVSSPIQAAIRLGEAMDASDKEETSMGGARPEFELLVLTKGRVAVCCHAPEPAHAASFAEFTFVRVTCGRFEMVLPFA